MVDVAEVLTIFDWPERNPRRLRAFSLIERCVQQEVERRTQAIQAFNNQASHKRLASAVLKGNDEKWILKTIACIWWEDEDD